MSISAAAGVQSFSPLTRLQDELASEVSSGTINSSDQSALGSALTDIDSELKSEMQSAGGSQPPSPGDMKSKIDTLIAGEVSSGKLTSAQADELKKVFANAFHGGPGGAGSANGAGGDGLVDSDNSNSTSSDISKLLQDFLKSIQDSKGGSSASYSTDGNSLAAQIQSLIVNYQT